MNPRRRAAGALGAIALLVAMPPVAEGLSCIAHADVREAAEEAVAGEHPLWADAYIVGRLDAVEPPRDHEPIVLVVTPTHVFGGHVAESIRLAARSDGPPPPDSWTVGNVYFLSLTEAHGLGGASAMVDPCAPTFRIGTVDELDRLVQAARSVEVRDPAGSLTWSDGALGSAPVLGVAVGVIGLGSWIAFRRRSRLDERPR